MIWLKQEDPKWGLPSFMLFLFLRGFPLRSSVGHFRAFLPCLRKPDRNRLFPASHFLTGLAAFERPFLLLADCSAFSTSSEAFLLYLRAIVTPFLTYKVSHPHKRIEEKVVIAFP